MWNIRKIRVLRLVHMNVKSHYIECAEQGQTCNEIQMKHSWEQTTMLLMCWCLNTLQLSTNGIINTNASLNHGAPVWPYPLSDFMNPVWNMMIGVDSMAGELCSAIPTNWVGVHQEWSDGSTLMKVPNFFY